MRHGEGSVMMIALLFESGLSVDDDVEHCVVDVDAKDETHEEMKTREAFDHCHPLLPSAIHSSTILHT
jgi:hypothetical protein